MCNGLVHKECNNDNFRIIRPEFGKSTLSVPFPDVILKHYIATTRYGNIYIKKKNKIS